MKLTSLDADQIAALEAGVPGFRDVLYECWEFDLDPEVIVLEATPMWWCLELRQGEFHIQFLVSMHTTRPNLLRKSSRF